MKRVAILGSTGSVGVTTLDVIGRAPERFQAVALAAGRNIGRLREQITRFQPRVVSVLTPEVAQELRDTTPGFRGEILAGEEGLRAVATCADADIVVSALVGAVGLTPTLEAIRAGKTIALANKEVMVVAGELVTREAAARGVRILPVDSEHSAIFQALAHHAPEDVRRIILTASGGPFLHTPIERLPRVTPTDALQHPTWKMGSKITIDSATLMNKGLEVIEARWLFGVDASRITVIVHPQSVVHSMVEFVDGSVMAQLAVPDMAIPVAYALAYPERIPLPHLPRLDLTAGSGLTFLTPEEEKFPCLGLAYRALLRGGDAAAVLNAANEIAVERFLGGDVRFTDIPRLIDEVLESHPTGPGASIDELLAADRWAREAARGHVRQLRAAV
jgi:1-deoxy-D-xylulose-5-phosphate reductoisomerase